MSNWTSLESFRKCKEEGLINAKQLQIVEYMACRDRPVSQREVQNSFGDTTSSLHPRFVELERQGAIVHVGETVNESTGRKVKVYRLGKPPTEKAPKRVTAKQVLKGLLDLGIEDFIYNIRENEGKGWDGPEVTRFADLLHQAKELL